MADDWNACMSFFGKKIPDFSLRAFTKGLVLPFRGAGYLIRHRGLKRYAALPLLANIILYALALFVFYHFLWNWSVGAVAWDFWGPVGRWLAEAVNWLGWLLKLVMAMLALGAAFFTFTGVGMVVASPLNDILSEKVELTYTDSESKLSMPLRFTTKAALLSFYDSLGNLARQLIFTILALPFLLVPLVGFVPLFLVGGYFAGFGFLDSAMARNFLRAPHKQLLSERRFWELIGFGVAMQACFAIPFLGLLLMPVGVTAGTLMYCDENWEKLLAEAEVKTPEGFQPPHQLEKSASRDLAKAAESAVPANASGDDKSARSAPSEKDASQ